MIAGHAAIAFALVAGVAVRFVGRRRALLVGLAAAAYAVVPDVDMAFAALEVLESGASGTWSATAAFWTGANAHHRTITHSLVLAVPAASGFALLADGRRLPGWLVLGALAGVVAAIGSPTALVSILLYVAAGAAIASAAIRYGLDAREVLIAALVGLLSHPFGDLFTGRPPAFLYPLDVTLVAERIVLHADPTLNLLAIFGLELAALWLAVVTAARVLGTPLRGRVYRRATAGTGYGAIAMVLPAPTLDVSYHFVFSVLAVGMVGAPLSRRPDRHELSRAAVTGLAAVTLGLLAAVAVYALG